MKILAPAKINLNLKIGAEQANGLHKIDTELHAVQLFDELEIQIGKESSDPKIRLIVDGAESKSVPANAQNTVYRGAQAFLRATNAQRNLEIRLTKNIPHQAGLGGGSADAGVLLTALEELFEQKLINKLEIAHQLGSDVPFFAHNIPHTRAQGTGEQIEPLTPLDFYCVIAMLPRIKIDTTWAFQNLGESDNFADVIFKYFPDLQNLRDQMLRMGAQESNLSGSGSAVFGVFKTAKAAQKCAQELDEICSFVWQGQSLTKNKIHDKME